MKKVLDYDPATGITETFYRDPITKKISINYSQDVEPMLDHNRVDSNNSQGWKGDMHKVASIPMGIVLIWREELKRKGLNPNPFCKENKNFLIAKLNDRDWCKIRTKHGTV